MLTQDEKLFIDYWGKNRLKEKKTFKNLLIGLPIGLVFALPILLNFFSGWFHNIRFMTKGTMITILIAVIIIAAFFAIFSRYYRWEKYEQHYLELLKKKQNSD